MAIIKKQNMRKSPITTWIKRYWLA